MFSDFFNRVSIMIIQTIPPFSANFDITQNKNHRIYLTQRYLYFLQYFCCQTNQQEEEKLSEDTFQESFDQNIRGRLPLSVRAAQGSSGKVDGSPFKKNSNGKLIILNSVQRRPENPNDRAGFNLNVQKAIVSERQGAAAVEGENNSESGSSSSASYDS